MEALLCRAPGQDRARFFMAVGLWRLGKTFPHVALYNDLITAGPTSSTDTKETPSMGLTPCEIRLSTQTDLTWNLVSATENHKFATFLRILVPVI